MSDRGVIGKLMEDALRVTQDVGGLTVIKRSCDLDYTDNLVRRLGSTELAQRALDRLARAVALFRKCFASSKCKVVLPNWMTLVPNLVLNGE